MSAWKMNRGWTERHGWGSDALARLIGRQRRETRRAMPAPCMSSEAVRDAGLAISEAFAAELAYDDALKAYDAAPLEPSAFDAARAAYVAADERRDRAREALRALGLR